MVIAAGYGLRLSADILEVLVTRAGPSGCLPASAIDVGRQSPQACAVILRLPRLYFMPRQFCQSSCDLSWSLSREVYAK